MKSFFTTFILTLLILASSIAQPQWPNHSKSFPKRDKLYNSISTTQSHNQYSSVQLDSFITAKMEQYHFPGLSACIIQDDSIIWKGSFGYANIEQNKLVTDSTLFHIASVSKPLTGTAIMQLWEEGLFGLDDDINNYLPFGVRNPSYPDDPITFRMLLTHTSSIRDNNTVLWPLFTPGSDSPIALGSFLENYLLPGGNHYNSGNWYAQPPGDKWDYANVGAALIGYLVEIISKTSFEQLCQDSIFVPLVLNESSWFLSNLDANNIATPYKYSGGNYIPSSHGGIPYYPAAQLRTSAIQLSRFIRAFIQMGQIDGIRILDSATVDTITTIQYPDIDPYTGLFWEIQQLNIPIIGERTICGHFGDWSTGANAYMGYILGTMENVGAIILANGRSYNAIMEIYVELLSYSLITTDIENEITNIPNNFFLNQNYPNPFNPSTTIEFTLPKSEFVELKVYNILGKEVTTLVSNKLNQGNHTYKFDGKNLASGVYYYELVAGDHREVKKMILLR